MKHPVLQTIAVGVVATTLLGCSGSDGSDRGSSSASLGFEIRMAQGVVITSVAYALETAGGAEVRGGIIPAPNDDSVINGMLTTLSAGSYGLSLSAVGAYRGGAVNCSTAPAAFEVLAGQHLTLATPLELVCTIENIVSDGSGRVTFGASVSVEQIVLTRRIVESFAVAPVSVIADTAGGACVFPPIGIEVANSNLDVDYGWSASPDGALALNASNTSGTYTCLSDGTKALTLSAALGDVTASRSVSVGCAGCTVPGVRGNGVLDPGEHCDTEAPSPGCASRRIATRVLPVRHASSAGE